MIPRHLEILFCDDVRHEVGGKLSFIGVYSGGLLVPKFPITLPKLCVSFKVVTPASEPLRSLTVSVLKDDETLQEMTVAEDELSGASGLTEDLPEDQRRDRFQMTQFLLVFSPIRFEKPCTLKVRAQTESDELRGVGLNVAEMPSPAESASESP